MRDLEKLSNDSLATVAQLVTADEEGAPLRLAPRFVAFLQDAVAFEQGRRAGRAAVESVDAPFPALGPDDLYAAAAVMTTLTHNRIAVPQVMARPALAGLSGPGRTLTAAELRQVEELHTFYSTVADALLRLLEQEPAAEC